MLIEGSDEPKDDCCRTMHLAHLLGLSGAAHGAYPGDPIAAAQVILSESSQTPHRAFSF